MKHSHTLMRGVPAPKADHKGTSHKVKIDGGSSRPESHSKVAIESSAPKDTYMIRGKVGGALK